MINGMNTVRSLNNSSGFFFVTTLIIVLLSFLLMIGLQFLSQRAILASAIQKQYTIALEFAKAAVEDFVFSLKNSSFNKAADPYWVAGHECKIQRETNSWSSFCSFCATSNCTSFSSPLDIINFPDWKKNYGDYDVFVKIVDVNYEPGTLVNKWFYSLEIVSTNKNSSVTAWLSVLVEIDN